MYTLNKIVGLVASPVAAAIIGGLIALLCVRLKRLRMAKWLGGLTVAWLWLWMTPTMVWLIGLPLESEFLEDGRVPAVESFPSADAIVVLGGGMGVRTNMSPYAEMWLSADRVWQAARLYNAGKAPKVIATGKGARESSLGILKDLGVPEDRIEFFSARNTEEEAIGVGKMGYSKILLVTSAWHMKRARMMFEMFAPDVDVICAPADFENAMKASSSLFHLPDPYCLYLNSLSLHEWVGIIGYTLFR